MWGPASAPSGAPGSPTPARRAPLRARPLPPGRGGTLTDGRAVEEEGHAEEHADTQGEDEGPPAAPAQRAAVTGGADDGREDEAEDGAQEPGQAVVLLRKAWSTGGGRSWGGHVHADTRAPGSSGDPARSEHRLPAWDI